MAAPPDAEAPELSGEKITSLLDVEGRWYAQYRNLEPWDDEDIAIEFFAEGSALLVDDRKEVKVEAELVDPGVVVLRHPDQPEMTVGIETREGVMFLDFSAPLRGKIGVFTRSEDGREFDDDVIVARRERETTEAEAWAQRLANALVAEIERSGGLVPERLDLLFDGEHMPIPDDPQSVLWADQLRGSSLVVDALARRAQGGAGRLDHLMRFNLIAIYRGQDISALPGETILLQELGPCEGDGSLLIRKNGEVSRAGLITSSRELAEQLRDFNPR
ncbi:MAG: hypothetical protein AAF800_12325 [Planctomycetota bacterium]